MNSQKKSTSETSQPKAEKETKGGQPDMSNFIGVSKITIGVIGLEMTLLKKLAEKYEGKETAICRVLGQAVNMEAKSTEKYGDYINFSGLFVATNYVTQETYQSGHLILPNVASGVLEGLLGNARAKSEDGKTGAVQFAYEIVIKGDPRSAVGYVFACRSLVAGDNPLAALFAKLPPIPAQKLLV